MPRPLKNEPVLPEDLLPITEALADLHGARGAGFTAPEPISWSEICAWLDVHNIKDDEDRAWYAERIRGADRIVLEWHAEKKGSG